ncbi:hypothetical protein SYJ56_19540 [Algoriphagus sp. D3-2-R+10]|uniref:hypothetical protein n=1 Tax=Algoriphagus aurantiacus TaxID=3103948 RepID=UPI002B3B5E88|nr:hypothetical protein [Algoriphagus sp. D3-2-R+10]MEB2777518.1 hypothetical protein [Algoriphagus sp. D3-2-R+10]
MKNNSIKKVFILLPDGIGLKNFAFSEFSKIGEAKGFSVIFWNKTPFNLHELGLHELELPNYKPSFLTSILKTVKSYIYLDFFTNKFNDSTFQSYKQKKLFSFKEFKSFFKFIIFYIFYLIFKIIGRNKIQSLINSIERRTKYYSVCKAQLLVEKPSFIFCTNQRPVTGISPLLAASDLGIPTSTFIFSWDNLPKATMVVKTDYYFVWSLYMKKEILKYYNEIKESQIMVTGTPQFEFYFNDNNILPKEEFYSQYNLKLDQEYICFSGDDITTSPYDPIYLRDLANSISLYNQHVDKKVGIIFRRSPVDLSNRYQSVLDDFRDLIHPIDPVWISFGSVWNEIMPTREDIKLLTSTVYYSKFVVNLGSSMVFDFIIYGKPCFFVNYNPNVNDDNWSVEKIYKYIHFKSMPSIDSVIWINSSDSFTEKVRLILNSNSKLDLSETKKWFDKIVSVPPPETSSKCWDYIIQIIQSK